MYRVGIAMKENEQENLQHIIQESFSGNWDFILLESQEKLLNSVREGEIDMLFLSLSLEAFSGLKALQSIREINKKLHICVCSSFFAADMVTELVLCGVDGYLSIPVKKVQVKQVAAKIIAEMEEDKIQWINQKGQENYLQQTRSILEYGFLHTILFGEIKESSLHTYCDALGMMYQGFMISVHPVDGLPKEDDVSERLQGKIKEIVGKYERSIVSSKMFQRFIVYSCWSREGMSERQKKSYFTAIGHELKKGIMEEFGISVKVGIGNVYPIKDIYLSYQEAINTVYFKKKGNVAIFRRDEGVLSHSEYLELLNRLLDAVKFGKNEALDIFSEILVSFENLEYEAKVNKIFQIIILSCHAAPLDGENELQFLNCMEFVKEIEQVKDVETWAYRKFELIFKLISESHGVGMPVAIHAAMDYIGSHYTSEISLEDVASYVGVSPQHFSKIFKNQTGTNYVDWIAHLRIEKAKQYLNVGDKTMKEICMLVGYKDPNYFSRIFKKNVGMTPSEYATGNKNRR